jgi:dipeptidyl aminopeptidase/acylaminoacyl peptidase
MRKILLLSVMLSFAAVNVEGQEASSKQETAVAHTKDGKKLFGTAEAMRVARVSSPRISPDGARVAYLVSEIQRGKDADASQKDEQPGKFVAQLWVVPTAGPSSAARQFTRGEKSVSNAKWSPDGKILAFTMDAGDEKDPKPQVWFLYADGGEAWQVTKHKSGVAGYEFSPDGKTLLLVATVPESADEEKRKKVTLRATRKSSSRTANLRRAIHDGRPTARTSRLRRTQPRCRTIAVCKRPWSSISQPASSAN